MKISTYRIRENVSFTDKLRNKIVFGTYIDILFDSADGKFLLPIFVLKTNNPEGKDTFYSVLGGLSQPRSRKNVIWHDQVVAKFPNAKKIVLFSHEYSCLRETHALSGQLLVKAILESDIDLIKPEGDIYGMGYSAGVGGIIDFTLAIQNSREFIEKYNKAKQITFIDPVGLSPNSQVVGDFVFTIYKSFLLRKRKGLNLKNAFKETVKEAKGTWMILDDRFATFREIFKDFALGLKRHLKEEISYFKFSKLVPIKFPVSVLRDGEFGEKAKLLEGDLKIKVLSATKGMDPLAVNLVNHLVSLKKIKNVLDLTHEEKVFISEKLSDIYHDTVFENLKRKNIDARVIEASHSMIFYEELVGKVVENLI